MKKIFYRFLIELTNRKWLSLLLRKFTLSRWSRLLIRPYMKAYQIPDGGWEKPIEQYSSLHEFFIRKLEKGRRLITEDPGQVISPVDGTVDACGRIEEGLVLRVKGRVYSLEELVMDPALAGSFERGTYLVIYLSPADYHHFHSPVSGNILRTWAIGNRSYPVNRFGHCYGKKILTSNYRRLFEIRHQQGHMIFIAIGAMLVNSIAVVRGKGKIERGEELGYFSFGSTVVLLFREGEFRLHPSIRVSGKIRMGEPIGTLLPVSLGHLDSVR
jgi:phosphatidylserine decarboxylase precursor